VALKGDTNKAQWEFRKRNQTTYPLAIDRTGRLGTRATGIPYTVLVDSKGVIRHINPTVDEATTERLKWRYLKMLSEKR
jgi:peroxiredoxin